MFRQRTMAGVPRAVLLSVLSAIMSAGGAGAQSSLGGTDAIRPGELLFASGFEGEVAVGSLVPYGNGAWQPVTGIDTETGFAWPPEIWGGTARFQLIAGDDVQVTPGALADRMTNEISVVVGPDGNETRALHQSVRQGIGGRDENWDSTQNSFVLLPGAGGQGDLYVSYWLRLEHDLAERLTVDFLDRRLGGPVIRALLPRVIEQAVDDPWAGRVVSDWKTGVGTGGGGDYRIILSIYGNRDLNRLYWNLKGDNVANGDLPAETFWELSNASAPVPTGRWFRLEVFVHRSAGEDGRVWVAVDDETVFDRYGSNMGIYRLPWNRIMPFLNYSTGQRLPAEQWIDDIEIWSGFPASASPR